MNEKYLTTNYFLAAFLIVNDRNFLGLEFKNGSNPNVASFVFEDDGSIDKLQHDFYYDYSVMVPVQRYIAELNKMKHLMNDEKNKRYKIRKKTYGK